MLSVRILGFLVLPLALGVAFVPAPSLADPALTSKLLIGPSGYDETFSGDGDFNSKNWLWSLSAEAAETLTTDNNGNPVLEHTDTFVMGFDFLSSTKLGAGIEYDYSLVPEENLQDNGPEVHFSGKLALDRPTTDSESDDDFSREIKVKGGAKYIRYLQSFNSSLESRKGVTYPLVGYNALRQISVEFFTTFDFVKWASVQLNFTYYFYDRNVASFLQYLNSSVAATIGASGFGSSVSGFPMTTDQLVVSLYPFEKWSVDLELIDNVQALDLSNAWTYDGTLFRELGFWKVGLGYEYETSEILTTNYFIISAEYVF